MKSELIPFGFDSNGFIEDNAQAIGADYTFSDGSKQKAGTIGTVGTTSFFPSKNLGCYGDGGAIMTNDDHLAKKLTMITNHGQEVKYIHKILGCNSRLDTIQAIVGNWLIPHTADIANQRIKNAKYYDDGLDKLKEISIPPRLKDFKIVYHLYIVFAEERDELLKYCLEKGIEAKVHYPVPIYRQPALKHLGHKLGDFPVSDEHTKKIISFPCDQHLSVEEMDYVIKTVSDFYKNK